MVIILAAATGGTYYYRATQVMPQAAIHFLTDVNVPRAGQRVLIFSPHPDDETIGAGAYILESVNRKAQVRIILITDGNKHNLAPLRYKEFRRSTRILGVKARDLVFLGFPDGKLKKEPRSLLYRVFKQEIDSYDPDIVIYPHPNDHHPDHAVAGEVIQRILDGEPRRRASYQYLVHHSRFPQPRKLRPGMYVLPPVGMVTFDREWRRLLIPNGIEKRKDRAIRCYRTQLRVPLLRSLLLSSVRRNELFSVNRADAP